MKIFYSWELDAPRKVNKDFIFEALNKAIEKLNEDPQVVEAERGELRVDQDTKDVLGSPEVARVILDKIAASDVIVTDVSLVASGPEDKPHINSNVAIELGYAYGKLGDQAVLKVMNTHFGQPENLPFDLRTRRHPVQYHLEPGADAATRGEVLGKLAGELASILRLYLESVPTEQVAPHVETPSTGNRGMYWQPSEPLIPAESGRRRQEVFWYAPRILYFRCIPTVALQEFSSREAEDATAELWPLLSEGGYSRSRNKWGALSHCVASDGEFMGATQVFRNREIWGVDAYYSNLHNNPEDDDEDPVEYLPTGAIHREYQRSIQSIRRLAATIGYGDQYVIEMGLSGAEGVRLAINKRYFDPFVGPIYSNEVYLRKTISVDYPTGAIMTDFWEKLFAEAGSEVPEELVWKPPKS